MKVTHVITSAPFEEADIQCERFALAFQAAGIEQRILAPPRSGCADRLRAAGLDVADMNLPGRIGFMARRRLDQVFARTTPDVVMSWSPDVTPLVDRGSYVHVARIGDAFRPTDHQTCASVFTPSKTRAEAARATGWPGDKIKVLPNLLSHGAPREPAASIDRRALFTPPTVRIVFTAGRLTADSGIDILIDAISRLTGVYLWIAGDGADRQRLESHALARGMKPRVRFLGWQADLRPHFAVCDAFAVPAISDDLPDFVLEGWLAGAPVIASDTLGAGLLIRDHETGILAPVGDAKAMAEAIRRVLADRDLAKRLGTAGQAAGARDFSPAALAAAAVDYVRSFHTR